MAAIRYLTGLLCLLIPLWGFAADTPVADKTPETRSLTVAGIAPQTNDDDPRVLYILPWQPPTLPRRPRTRLNDKAPDLKQPVDPLTLERHRYFRNTLDPDIGAAVPRL